MGGWGVGKVRGAFPRASTSCLRTLLSLVIIQNTKAQYHPLFNPCKHLKQVSAVRSSEETEPPSKKLAQSYCT